MYNKVVTSFSPIKLAQIAQVIRSDILHSIYTTGSGHLAGSLGVVEILTYLYFVALNLRPQQPDWHERDLFFLSAGHLCPALYATLAQRGFFARKILSSLRQFGSPLQGHPRRQLSLGIECSAGSLGQGISQAVGAAYALKQSGSKRKVVVLASDGEQQEGQCWEAYLFAAHYHLDNLTLIVDVNGIQQSGLVKQVISLEDLAAKFLSFNFACTRPAGNDFSALHQAWQQLTAVKNYPKAILATTTPGKGVPLLENNYHYHAGMPSAALWQQIFAASKTESVA